MTRPKHTGYYVKSAIRPTTPGVWFCVYLHPKLSGVRGSKHLTRKSWGSASVGVIYKTRRGWTHPEVVRVSTPEAMREWMDQHHLPGRVNWVITPRVDETLTLSQWWSYAEAKGIVWGNVPEDRSGVSRPDTGHAPITLRRFAVSPDVGILSYVECGRRWQWVGFANYGQAFSEAGAGDAAYHRRHCEPVGVSPSEPERRGVEACRSALGVAKELCDWWREHSRAGWQSTVGQLAVGILRSYAPKRSLLVHRDSEVHALERAAAFGGRASVWYIGSVGDGIGAPAVHVDRDGNRTVRREDGPVHHLDVRAQYPTLLRDKLFPTKLGPIPATCTPTVLDQLLDDYGIIARVTIRTRRAEYPYRTTRGVAYPVGVFTTTLTGPELITLRRDGEVLACHQIATYHLTSALSAPARFLLDNRRSADSTPSASKRGFAKLLANSIAGKLAQRAGAWVREPDRDTPHEWGERYVLSPDGEVRTRYRWRMGLCERWDDDKTGRGPHTACFAYLAAYGRVQMREFRDRCVDWGVVSQDTDGIWVLDSSIAALGSLPSKDDGEPGQLCRVASVRNARWFDARHYYTDGEWTLAGFGQPSPPDAKLKIWDSRQSLPWNSKTRVAPDECFVEQRESDLCIDAPYGNVSRDGWVTPRLILPPKGEPAPGV